MANIDMPITGSAVSAEHKRKHVDECLDQLQLIAENHDDTLLENSINFYRKNFFLSPKYAYVLFSRMDDHEMRYNPNYFKVSLEKGVFKNDLRQMPTEKVHKIWAALDSGQKQTAVRSGHSMP